MTKKTKWGALLGTVLIAAVALGQSGGGENQPVNAVPDVGVSVSDVGDLTKSELDTLDASVQTDAIAMSNGETTEAEVRRDPARALDLGSDWRSSVIALLFSILAPIVTNKLKDWGIAKPNNTAIINLGIGGAIGWGLWALLHSHFPNLPQDAPSWIMLGTLGSGFGQAFRSSYVNNKEKSNGPTF